MSYPKDLEEYTDRELRQELVRRSQSRAGDKCPYCHKPLSNNKGTCRFHERGGIITGTYYEQVFAGGNSDDS